MEEESVPEQQLLAEVKDEFGRKRIFGQQGTLRLIECVRQRPKLWHRQYLRSRASGIDDWEDIQRTEFSTISVNQLRVRWKTLRDCFRREAKRIEDGTIPAIRWPLYDHMQFLHGHF
ncbi:AGAP011592-PA, partial [Anopheles gambiae str. PEST]